MRDRRFVFAPAIFAALSALCASAAPAFAQGTPPAPAFSRMDSLFLAAATGEPRLQAVRDSSAKILIGLGDVTLEYLARERLRGQTPRQQHYVERLFTVISDSGRNAGPRRVVARALVEASDDTVRAQFLYIGSAIGDSAFLEVALPWLESPSSAVRRNALRALGQYPRADLRALLEDRLWTTEGLERHQVLWALEKQPGKTDPRLLVPLLRDPYFFNRQKARDLMLKDADSAWAALAPFLPPKMEREERREWAWLARAAKGGDAFLRGLVMTREERAMFGEGIKAGN